MDQQLLGLTIPWLTVKEEKTSSAKKDIKGIQVLHFISFKKRF